MYSGTTLTSLSGRFIGAHQKIDRLAEVQLIKLLGNNKQFPPIRKILHFEGNNGPDGIKRKSPSKDEPWHYFQPDNLNDTGLLEIIQSHYDRLIESLKQLDEVRSSFEAAWLAHALVDGLTPAHHYPYGQKMVELREGESLDTRSSIKDKLMMPGATLWKFFKNNWKFWGPKGLFMTHASFELGIAMAIKPLSLKEVLINPEDMPTKVNLSKWYRQRALNVVNMNLYSQFYDHGWTIALAKKIKKDLMPIIVETVALVWYSAVKEAAVDTELAEVNT